MSPVTLDYHRFSFIGGAYLTVSHPNFLESTLVKLQKMSFFGLPTTAHTCLPPSEPNPRMRGKKGRSEAAVRAIVSGNGSQGGISETDEAVAIIGLPGRMTVEAMRPFLRDYKLASGEGAIVKLEK